MERCSGWALLHQPASPRQLHHRRAVHPSPRGTPPRAVPPQHRVPSPAGLARSPRRRMRYGNSAQPAAPAFPPFPGRGGRKRRTGDFLGGTRPRTGRAEIRRGGIIPKGARIIRGARRGAGRGIICREGDNPREGGGSRAGRGGSSGNPLEERKRGRGWVGVIRAGR